MGSPLSIQDVLSSVRSLTFLTGAGVSTDSGIPDFKTIDEHWTFPVSRQRATSISYFHKDPVAFWEAFRYMFTLKTSMTPNSFHQAIAGLEAKGKNVTVITQNIDGLHSLAGSSRVLEMHGSLREARCNRPSCPVRVPLASLDGDPMPRCPRCNKLMRPDVVLFGEMPFFMDIAQREAIQASVLIVAGTALEVGPVNTFPHLRDWDNPALPTVWLNRETPPAGYNFSHSLVAPLSDAAALLESVTA